MQNKKQGILPEEWKNRKRHWVFHDEREYLCRLGASPNEILIYETLSMIEFQSGKNYGREFNAGEQQIMGLCNIKSRKTIRKALQSLVDRGMIKREIKQYYNERTGKMSKKSKNHFVLEHHLTGKAAAIQQYNAPAVDGIKSKPMRQADIEAIQEAAEKHLPELCKKWQGIKGSRLEQITQLWNINPEIEWFEKLFEKAANSEWLQEQEWWSFKWLIDERNAFNILDGQYDKKFESNSSRTGAPQIQDLRKVMMKYHEPDRKMDPIIQTQMRRDSADE